MENNLSNISVLSNKARELQGTLKWKS